MEWSGMEWNGMERNGMEWNGMEWNGMEWNGMEWGILYIGPRGPALHARHLDVGVVCLRSKRETGLAELFWTVTRRGEGTPLPPCATHRHLDRSWMVAAPRDAAGAAAALFKWDGVDGDSFLGLSLAVGDRWGRPRRATTVTGEHIALVFLDTEVSRRGCGVM